MMNGLKGEETLASDGPLQPAPSVPVLVRLQIPCRDWLSGRTGGVHNWLDNPVKSEYCLQKAGWCGSTLAHSLWQIRNSEETAGIQGVD